MGGSGSTRWNGHRRRATVRDATRAGVALAVADFRAVLRAPAPARGHLTRTGTPRYGFRLDAYGGPDVGARPAPRRLTLTPPPTDDALPGDGPALATWSAVPHVQRLPAGSAGARWWWWCAGCGTRRAVVYLATWPGSRGPDVVRCRLCLGLAYDVQRFGPLARTVYAADKAAARLGARYEWHAPHPPKPPRMHRTTYARHLATLATAEAHGDALTLAAAMRWFWW